ncbi:MAG: nitrite reductase small subunit NirD [Pseudomonadota bacterium]
MTENAQWTQVCALADIIPNAGVCAKVGEAQVAVFRLVSPQGVEEGVFALGNFEPKSKANVLSRGLVGDVGGVSVVASPVYKNHYALTTGVCLEEEAFSVPVYAVRVVEGLVIVGAAL